MADDIVELAGDAGTLVGNCVTRTLFALAFGPRRALPRLVGLCELASEREADNPDDREDEADEDELADLAARIVADDDRFHADGHCHAGHGLAWVGKLSEQEDGCAAREKRDDVPRDEAVVRKRGDDDAGAYGQRCPERKPTAQEQRPDDEHREDDVEPHRALRAVRVPLPEDGAGNRHADTEDEEGVEPVAPRQRRELPHGLKVLRKQSPRLARANDPKLVPEDEDKSSAGPKRKPDHATYRGRMQFVVETSGLSKHFGERVAVSSVDLRVPRGAAFGYLGPNGAGKTTLIRMLLGLTTATSGSMQLLGRPVPAERKAALARVGAIVEEPRFHPHLTGRENLTVIAAARERAAHDRIDGALARVGLTQRADERVKRYSLGMRQRLGVARSLLADPELLILDEPTNGLDPAGIHEFRDMIRGFVAEGRTVLLSSHLLDEVEKICDEVAIVDRGKVVAQGPIDALAAGAKQTILIATSDDEHALGILSAHRGVELAAREPLGIRVTLRDDAGDELSRRLVTAGLAIRRFEPARASLEQRFLEITSRLEEAA